MAFRVTYATLSADNEEMHAACERGIDIARDYLQPYLRDQSSMVGA